MSLRAVLILTAVLIGCGPQPVPPERQQSLLQQAEPHIAELLDAMHVLCLAELSDPKRDLELRRTGFLRVDDSAIAQANAPRSYFAKDLLDTLASVGLKPSATSTTGRVFYRKIVNKTEPQRGLFGGSQVDARNQTVMSLQNNAGKCGGLVQDVAFQAAGAQKSVTYGKEKLLKKTSNTTRSLVTLPSQSGRSNAEIVRLGKQDALMTVGYLPGSQVRSGRQVTTRVAGLTIEVVPLKKN